jgi:anti-sigma B factor antagonist
MSEADLAIAVVDGVPVVATPEEIDVTNAAVLRTALLRASAHATSALVVDMVRTQFCDSAGIHVLVGAHMRAQAEGAELLLVLPATTVSRAFAITGVDRVIPNFSGLEEALAYAAGARSAVTSRR